jgi:hypothetical protein
MAMVRIQLELDPERVEDLDLLQNELKLATRKSLFNNALTFFEWAVREIKAGRTIASVDAEGMVREVTMPAFSNIKVPVTQRT